MADNIEYNQLTGTHSFVDARYSAWHKLGKTANGAMTAKEALEWSNQNFEVEKVQMFNPVTGELTEFYGVVRMDNSEVLSVVSESYHVIQTAFQFKIIDEIIGNIGGAHYETAGVLGKGEKFFASASIGSFDILGTGDKHNNYLLGCGSHDGSLSQTFKLTSTRVVCQNTLNIALSGNGESVKAKHTKNAKSKLNNSVKLLNQTQNTAKSLQEKLEFLAQKVVTKDVRMEVFKQLFDVKAEKDLTSQKAGKINDITNLFESNDKNAFPEFRGTGYNLLNAITEYTDHFRGNDELQRANSAMFGSGDKFKTESMNLVIELLQNAESVNQEKVYSFVGVDSVVSDLLGV